MPITALIVDDEPLARNRIRRLLRTATDLKIVGEAASGEEALRIVDEQSPRVRLFDVQMPRMDGFEVVRRIPKESRALIVYVTAYQEYALDAFRAAAVQYILKPVEREPLRLALTRVRELVAARSSPSLTAFLEQKLDSTQFGRIHRTTIVNLQHLRGPASHGGHIVMLQDGTQLQISRAYRERLDGSPQ